MLRAIYDFIASDAYELVARGLLIWGLTGLVMLFLGFAQSRPRRIVAWTGVALMVASAVFSMIFEDFLPGLESGRTGPANAVGMVLLLTGTAVFAWGGYVFARDTFGRMGKAARPRFGRGRKGAGEAPVEYEKIAVTGWLGAWGPALALMAGGFLVIVLGASLNNDNRFPLAWFWGMFGL